MNPLFHCHSEERSDESTERSDKRRRRDGANLSLDEGEIPRFARDDRG